MDARGKTVLLVEDCEKYGNATVRALEESHIANELVGATTGEQALELLVAAGSADVALPQVVLLDPDLPGMKGLEVLRRIRADTRTRYLPVVVLTSSDEERDRMAAYDQYANSYVRKPVDYDEFVAASRGLGLYWTVTNLPPPPPSERPTRPKS